MTRGARRLLTRGLIAIAIGAVVTIVVAWVAWGTMPPRPTIPSNLDTVRFIEFQWPGEPPVHRHGTVIQRRAARYVMIDGDQGPAGSPTLDRWRIETPWWLRGPISERLRRMDELQPLPDDVYAEDVRQTASIRAAGWPLPAMWGGFVMQNSSDPFMQRVIELPAARLVPMEDTVAVLNVEGLPTSVLWRGFIINTLVVATPLWLLLVGCSAATRAWRRRSGARSECGAIA